MLKSLLILLISTFFFISTTTAAICSGTDLTDEIRKKIVDVHNEFRSELAQGKSLLKNGKTAPSAKNMYKMRYDCCLEATAQSVADTCVMKHSDGECRHAGENLWMKGGTADQKNDIPSGIKLWWSELSKKGEIEKETTFAGDWADIGHWSQMAAPKTIAVGCGYKSCSNGNTVLACHYRENRMVQGNLYELGEPCKSDDQCTKYPNSKCDAKSGLCETTAIVKGDWYS